MRVAFFEALRTDPQFALPGEAAVPLTMYDVKMRGFGIEADGAISFLSENGLKVTFSPAEISLLQSALNV